MPTDPRGLRADAPLLDAWLRFQEEAPTPFTIPGHKHRLDLVGDVIAGDVPYFAGLDTMKLERGVLADAEQRAAALWGADHCRFSVGGSTHANQAIALSVGRPGDTVVVARTLHRSMLLGLVLAGLEPEWVVPDTDPTTGMPGVVTAAAVASALRRAPHAVAVFIGHPSYVGTLGDVAAIAMVAHGHGTHGIPLVVDQAWGAHFGFHPGLPDHAISLGADAMVTSAHKGLPAWSQAALVLARGERIDRARLEAGVEATATTSPSGAILASMDAARALLAREGEQLLGDVMAAVAAARRRLAQVEDLIVLDGDDVDPLRIVLLLARAGVDGNLVEHDLLAAGLPVELADRDTVIAVVSIADTAETIARLTECLVESVSARRGEQRPMISGAWSPWPQRGMSPREAFFARHEQVDLAAARGRVSAELIAPYPPGIPVLAPGEVVTDEVLDALSCARAAGRRIAYAADPSGESVRVAVPRTTGGGRDDLP